MFNVKKKVFTQRFLFSKFFCVFLLIFILIGLTSCRDYEKLGKDALEIGDYARAELFFDKALDKNPKSRDSRYGNALAKYGLAEELERTGIISVEHWQRSANEFRILFHLDSSFSVRSIYSNCLFYLARSVMFKSPDADISDLLKRSIALDSMNYFAYNLKALLHESQGDFNAAEETFIYMLSRFPEFEIGYLNFGNYYWKRDLVGDAWDIWSMGLERFPNHEELKYWTKKAEEILSKEIQK